MREIVDQLVNGFFEYENRKLTISESKIETSLHADEIYRGSFHITNVDGVLIKGYLYSSDARMHLVTKEFEDADTEIMYEYSAVGLSEGDVQKGDIYIVSDSGEYYLPFVISIDHHPVSGTQGIIRNLFHFANLAQSDWEEAVNLFYSKDFIKIFEGNERAWLKKYKGLSKTFGSEQNVDEFLVAVNKKQSIIYTAEQTLYEFKDIRETIGASISIQKIGWGYVNLQITSDSLFLKIEKEHLSDDDFLGNTCDLPVFIHPEELHAGKNYGRLTLSNYNQSFDIVVIAEPEEHTNAAKTTAKELHKLQWKLMKNYIAFRIRQMPLGSWVRESMKIVERMITLDGKNPVPRLFQAQLLMVDERENEAQWILEHVENDMDIKHQNADVYCYYLYLSTLLNREESYVNRIAEEIKEIYKMNRTSWRILWTLLYLDEELADHPAKRLAMIERQYEGGCTSPVIYAEAYHDFVMNPAGLTKLTEFEMQILLWAVRNKQMDRELLKQVIYLTNRQKNFSETLLYILTEAYKTQQNDELTGAVCSLLIKGNCTNVKYFKWFKRGVEAEMRITRLYEYFMLSIPLSYEDLLPRPVMMYFTYNNNLDYVRTAYLYANMLHHENEIPEMVRSYERLMQQFVKEQILQEHMSRDLAYIYSKILKSDNVSADMAPHLAKMIFTREVAVDNPVFKEIIVVYSQLTEEYSYPINDGLAYPQVYGRDYEMFLQDGDGNRTVLPENSDTKLMEEETFIYAVHDFVTGNIGFCLYLCEGKRHYVVIDDHNAEFCRVLVESPLVQEDYKREIRVMLLHYYYDHDDMVNLDELLLAIDSAALNSKDRAELVEYLVRRGMYDEGYHIVDTYGMEQISSKTCVKLCSNRILHQEDAADEKLLALCYQAFKANKYDIVTLTYLTTNFRGLTKEMRNVWKAAVMFDIDAYYLEERLIIQMLYTGTTVGEKEEIFDAYLKAGSNTAVELAYLSFNAYDYFVRDRMIEDKTFEHLLHNYRRGENLNDACRLALLKYYTEEHARDAEINQMIAVFIKEFIHKNMYFKFFMDFIDIVPELFMYADKTIIEYKANPQSRVVLHYVLEGQEENGDLYKKEDMRNMYGGIYTKEFILFFGENLQYYITEMNGDKEKLTESNSVSISDVIADNEENRFELLNDMVVAQTLQDEDSLMKLMEKYVQTDYVVNRIFTLR
ncbi:MAG: DUF5717 family protein [bacterium]|nr:DUF5717 family protein [bacterium]